MGKLQKGFLSVSLVWRNSCSKTGNTIRNKISLQTALAIRLAFLHFLARIHSRKQYVHLRHIIVFVHDHLLSVYPLRAADLIILCTKWNLNLSQQKRGREFKDQSMPLQQSLLTCLNNRRLRFSLKDFYMNSTHPDLIRTCLSYSHQPLFKGFE